MKDTALLFSFIDEIKEDHDNFLKTRVNIDPIKRDELIEIINDLGITLNHASAHSLLKIHATNCDRILDEDFARRLLSRPGFQAIVKNKKFFFDGVKDTEQKARILARLVSLNLDSDEKINDLVAALKKAPNTVKKSPRRPHADDLEFAVIDVVRNVQSGMSLSRFEIAAKLGLNSNDATMMQKLTGVLMKLSTENRVAYNGERGSRRYFGKRSKRA